MSLPKQWEETAQEAVRLEQASEAILQEVEKMSRPQQVFDFIVKFKQEHNGNSPTIREISDACGIPSTSSVNYYLEKLVKKGLLHRDHSSRGIEVIGGKWSLG